MKRLTRDLLQFHARHGHGRQVRSEREVQFHPLADHLAAQQFQHFDDEIIEAGRFAHRGLLPDHRSEIVHHSAGAFVVPHDIVENRVQFVRITFAILEKAPRGLGIAENGGQRLIQFVGNGGGQFAEGGDPHGVGQFVAQLLFAHFRALAGHDIADDLGDQFQLGDDIVPPLAFRLPRGKGERAKGLAVGDKGKGQA